MKGVLIMNKANHAIEISLKGNELNEETLLKVLESINKEIQNNNKDIFISRSVNENFLDELISKYDDHETPFLKLNEELSNKQIKSYKDNFKNFNSDFKLIKNDKDDFSILLSSQNKEVLSDAIRIIPKMKKVTLENDSVIQKQKELETLINKINSFYEDDKQGLAALDFAKTFDNLVTALEINHEEINSDQTEQELQETLEDFMHTSSEEDREILNVYSAVDDTKLKIDDIYNGYEISDAEKEILTIQKNIGFGNKEVVMNDELNFGMFEAEAHPKDTEKLSKLLEIYNRGGDSEKKSKTTFNDIKKDISDRSIKTEDSKKIKSEQLL